ncbi:dynamin family protein [Brachyspira intermedia]|uniref:dynamin family protein n=1 Tax=Brachyspira intermedia TaxID=84377 RepID=UPI003003DE44
MKEIYFEYNPFTLEFIVKENGEKFDPESRIYEHINSKKRLQFWLNELIPILYENINESFNLTFRGTVLDYEDLQLEVEHFNNENKTNITLEHKQVRSVDDRIKKLKEIFDYMQATTPFKELKNESVIKQFNDAIGKDFELAVIATMSSGKSTLLNSLLGRELMPSKNQACTATIARIRDVDGMTGASAKCLDDKENVVINEVTDITVENMREFNDNENVSYIDVRVDIPFVSSHNLELVLLDTPGPNNSRDISHKKKTYKIIDESDPLVLYVLNATQLGINDDNLLLKKVAEAMDKGGKQAKDRFIFVVNKLDDYDLENGDSIKKAYNDIVSYLKSHGIVKPNIYLVSAQTALITRLIKNNYPVTKKQNREFETAKELFEEFEELHLSKYAALSKSGHDKIDTMLKNAEDELDTLLVHTGVPAVEIAINDYLEKYAMAEKVKKAVDSFIGYIEKEKMQEQIAEELSKNENALKAFNIAIGNIRNQLADGEKGKKYRDKIKQLDMSQDIKYKLDNIIKEFGIELHNELDYLSEGRSEIVSKYEGQEYIKHMESIITNQLINFQINVENSLFRSIVEKGDGFIDEYKREISSLLKELNINNLDLNVGFNFDYLFNSSKNDVNSSFDAHIEQVTVKDSKWWNPFSWFKTKQVDRFNIKEYNDDVLARLMNNMDNGCQDIAKYINEEILSQYKEHLLEQVDKLEKLISNKMKELENMTSKKENTEKYIEENKDNKQWLENFIKELKTIIEL